MNKSGLTDKKMSDRRFRRTEDAIIGAFSVVGGFSNLADVIKKAKISRATFYRHHGSIQKIVLDYEEYLMSRYLRIVKNRRKKKNIGKKDVFRQMLVFIMANKKVLLVLLKNGNGEIIRRMVRALKPNIVRVYKWSKCSGRVFEIYVNEILAIIQDWAKDMFSEDKLDKVLWEIVYLTETAKKRLRPLEE